MPTGTGFVPAGAKQEETMNVIISGVTPNPAAATKPRSPAPKTVHAPTANHTPAATVEISSAARNAHSAGPGHTAEHKLRPLNIIWGNSPR